MYNEDFVQHIIEKHGREQAMIFCELEAKRNDMIVREFQQMKNIPYDHYLDYDYERSWWTGRLNKFKTESNESI